ncbi:alpha/beta hydrolase [Intrasporangium sp. YIM S08009]|uniref:alpha/beta fold hydrolase n=1 Tax=Intrasporangium zincisolvens TaxID=3080018 RepID=UPI002B055CB9|nr:alpha/beta hydrolase [Intrasporangium sp. YIM S08009]
MVTSPDGTRIAWTRRGDGPPVVMVSPVMACRERSPQPDLPRALAQRYTVLTYDRRGTGESLEEPGTTYAVEREFDDLAAVLDLAGPDALVYGFSSGATLALLGAANGLPVARLLLMEPPLVADPDLAPLAEARRRLAADPADARKWFDEEVTRIPAEIRAQFPPPSPLDLANAPAMLHELAFLPGTTAEQFRGVTVPTLLVASDHTAPVLLEATRALGEALPHAVVRVLPGQWHGVPDAVVVAEVDAFLGRDRDLEKESAR